MKCWIFHDWKPVEGWAHTNGQDPKIEYAEIAVVGSECRKCGRRKVKKVGGVSGGQAAPYPYQQALNWMKEEVIRA